MNTSSRLINLKAALTSLTGERVEPEAWKRRTSDGRNIIFVRNLEKNIFHLSDSVDTRFGNALFLLRGMLDQNVKMSSAMWINSASVLVIYNMNICSVPSSELILTLNTNLKIPNFRIVYITLLYMFSV